MNTSLNSDDFYVLNPNSGDHFSVAGIQFIGELVDKAAREVGWDPTKVCFGVDYTQIWVGYPSAATKVIENVHVKDGFLHYRPRVVPKGQSRWMERKLPLADPNLFKALGEIMVASLPKKSKFFV